MLKNGWKCKHDETTAFKICKSTMKTRAPARHSKTSDLNAIPPPGVSQQFLHAGESLDVEPRNKLESGQRGDCKPRVFGIMGRKKGHAPNIDGGKGEDL